MYTVKSSVFETVREQWNDEIANRIKQQNVMSMEASPRQPYADLAREVEQKDSQDMMFFRCRRANKFLRGRAPSHATYENSIFLVDVFFPDCCVRCERRW